MRYNIFLMVVCLLVILRITTEIEAQVIFPQQDAGINLTYDYLSPHKAYSDWKGIEGRYILRFDAKNAMALTLGSSIRDEDFVYISAGYYRDWLSRFYTYSSLGFASQTKWMGKFRVDNELNYKFGDKLQYIVSSGQSVIYFEREKQDYIISLGGLVYMPHWVLDAKYFFNRSDPEEVWSNTTKLSFSFGTQKKTWGTISLTSGSQAYQGRLDEIPVDQKLRSIDINQLIWTRSNQGLKIGLGYLNLIDAYEKYNFRLGYFLQIN